jgi:DNA recombination protein RmuC
METLVIYLIVALLIVLVFLVYKYGNKDQNNKPLEDFQRKLTDDLAAIRREARELNAENRKEVNDLFKSLQDSLLNRVSESVQMQKTEFDQFAKSLAEFSDKKLKPKIRRKTEWS